MMSERVETKGVPETCPGNGQSPACEAGCDSAGGCHAGGSNPRRRHKICHVVMGLAALLLARALLSNRRSDAMEQTTAFDATRDRGPVSTVAESAGDIASGAIGQSLDRGSGPAASVVCGREIRSLGTLNRPAADWEVALVYVPGIDREAAVAAAGEVKKAAKTLAEQNHKIEVFTLSSASPERNALTTHMPLPGVLVIRKGTGSSTTRGAVTETAILQAVAAAGEVASANPLPTKLRQE